MRGVAVCALLLAAGFGAYALALEAELEHPLVAVGGCAASLVLVYIGEMWSFWRRK